MRGQLATTLEAVDSAHPGRSGVRNVLQTFEISNSMLKRRHNQELRTKQLTDDMSNGLVDISSRRRQVSSVSSLGHRYDQRLRMEDISEGRREDEGTMGLSDRNYEVSSRSSMSGLSNISSTHDAAADKKMEFIWWIAIRLTSYDEEMHKEILEDFFTEDAKYIHPALTVEGRYNIRKVFRVWTSLNKDEPLVTDIVFDGHTAVISLIQNLRPRLFPLVHLQVPATTTLHFRDSPVGPMIVSHQDSWTLEGIVQSMPLLGWWYDHVVRNVLGSVMTSAGGFLHTANQTTGYLQFRAEEIQKISSEIIDKSSADIQQRSRDMTAKAQLMVDQAKDTVEKRVATAREEVKRMRQMMRPLPVTKAITSADNHA
ncbi:hypothetical protein BGZ65_004048 [Modicella reniformis]|uniref:SigF-like NTF2-like domain-containing protein n=1 Tax=Modicella reniformis TaxID=1440133 RepID=A0A9P6INL8_9FUNG|nr:hypothetical protein BGZ65_004048 [Modicella reniformis]